MKNPEKLLIIFSVWNAAPAPPPSCTHKCSHKMCKNNKAYELHFQRAKGNG